MSAAISVFAALMNGLRIDLLKSIIQINHKYSTPQQKIEEKLTATLTGTQEDTFEKYEDCNHEISEICEREVFLCGFRLGARFIIDVVNN